MDIDDFPKVDASEIQNCTCCGKGVAHTGAPVFYEMTITPCIFDTQNIQRMHGLELMMGGNAGIARVFSPDNTIARKPSVPIKRWICSECAMVPMFPLSLLEESTHG